MEQEAEARAKELQEVRGRDKGRGFGRGGGALLAGFRPFMRMHPPRQVVNSANDRDGCLGAFARPGASFSLSVLFSRA